MHKINRLLAATMSLPLTLGAVGLTSTSFRPRKTALKGRHRRKHLEKAGKSGLFLIKPNDRAIPGGTPTGPVTHRKAG